jgi:hypothetical protein
VFFEGQNDNVAYDEGTDAVLSKGQSQVRESDKSDNLDHIRVKDAK